MVAALRTEDRVHGLLLVAGRFGDVTTFTGTDLALLETFARHVATSLERGRLEETLRQVTDLKEQLRHQALHDPLTGLPNRTLFLDRARQAVDLAGRTHCGPPCLHRPRRLQAGQRHLRPRGRRRAARTVADRLTGCLRPADTAARLGGDEFAVLLNGPIDRLRRRPGASTASAASCDVPVRPRRRRGSPTVGASIGVALGGEGVDDADTLIRQADIAMYAAKRGGGNDYLFYETGWAPAVARKDSRPSSPPPSARGEMRAVYQPLIDMRTGRPIGAEALVRWQHPTDGIRSPDTFIGLAEDTGLITELGAFVLRDACRAGRPLGAHDRRRSRAAWSRSTCPRGRSPTRRSCDQVCAALADAGLEPRRLVLEITETVLMQDRDAAASTLWQLKALGVRIAIDDFGTGYSSLAYLRRFPIDMLKVAREFVDGLGRDANDDAITRAIVELAGTLGLLTIAEGIETHAAVRAVRRARAATWPRATSSPARSPPTW